MGSLLLPTPVEERPPQPQRTESASTKQGLLLVAGLGNPVAADYAAFVRRLGHDNVAVVTDTRELADAGRPVESLVFFLDRQLTDGDRHAIDELLALAGKHRVEFVGIVSSAWPHLGDSDSAEAYALQRATALPTRTAVFRCGHVLSPNAPLTRALRRYGSCYPLVPARLQSCYVDGDELFTAIETERREGSPHRMRTYTLLGPNQPWRTVLARHQSKNVFQICLTALSTLASLLMLGHLAGLILDLLSHRKPALKRWNFDTLQPRSFQELLALYNKYNAHHVKIVGYNNGVVHFGHRYQGKTIVSTVFCNRVKLAGHDLIKADCGTTIRKALDVLAKSGQTLPVIPNYSYVSLGTAFFIPIHGSAADYSCVAETITKVVYYDPLRDRCVVAMSDQPAFRDLVYNLRSDVLLLRLYLRTKPRSDFSVQRQELKTPSSAELVAALCDQRAANVEIRKSRAASESVQIYRYFKAASDGQSPGLDLPRDSLGSLWDKLEENAVTSFLMHALTRHFAFHLELFFTADEFAAFWKTHRTLPIRKLQLRYMRRDGFPHSPFCDHDCISADMFMFRRHRRRFEAYLKQAFPVVRSNPGKHSR